LSDISRIPPQPGVGLSLSGTRAGLNLCPNIIGPRKAMHVLGRPRKISIHLLGPGSCPGAGGGSRKSQVPRSTGCGGCDVPSGLANQDARQGWLSGGRRNNIRAQGKLSFSISE